MSPARIVCLASATANFPYYSGPLNMPVYVLKRIGGTQCSYKKNYIVGIITGKANILSLFTMCENDSSAQEQCVMCGARVKFQAHLALCSMCLVQAGTV